ncbi:hypothetical protein WH52_07210 [Tenacibaculum holothuriorum]|uniref:DUF262 domain-containing protein n=1 Tax=Tenacibaculum holothuriorum TaxID=1635173 RepID=A0A1Y2PFN3_9FLAO|nr:DUF262 domain-containing protein [Tenacibaculum holothuriorum]OSY88529.1 hypothetical protein WH52_07210 [Tenacibaculum holothuriorum]
MESKLDQLNIQEVFSNNKYTIPVYQRNYAWKEAQVSQLIQDIYDYAINENTNSQNYYIGSLVVFERKAIDGSIIYETIDGQQRLTTLNILLSVLKNEFDINIDNYKTNLHFDSRPMSSKTLEHIYNKTKNEDINKSEKDLNTRITDAYTTTTNQLNKLKANNHLKKFVTYLKDKVILLRVPVPHDTDLNHYFEIMNNRGEQLEKHEVLKAKMLKVFKDDKKATKAFNSIWEACANMEKYVQYGFKPNDRVELFGGDWNNLKATNFNEILSCFKNEEDNINQDELSIQELLKSTYTVDFQNKNEEDSPERFNSVINFSNFLLHILRILVNQYDAYTTFDKNIPLDDKRLLDTFEYFLRLDEQPKKEFVEDFAFLLLKGKFFYDKYIIKRNLKNDKWSLKYLKGVDKKPRYLNSFGNEFDNDLNGLNKKILMLLSMFHVSAPTLIYKHWLNASLNYLLNQEVLSDEAYIQYLEKLSDAFLYDRFLAHNELDYYEIIYTNNGIPTNETKDLALNKLNQGTQVENFIFNRLDYLLWKKDQHSEKKEFSDFIFSFRTSVEHYYPQNPLEGQEKIEKNTLDNFGNLCLISRSKNSKLSNYMPTAKKEHYKNKDSIESIKQQLMMRKEFWNVFEIREHSEKMKSILIQRTN